MMSRQTPRASRCTKTMRSSASVVLVVVSTLGAAGCVSKPTLAMFQAEDPPCYDRSVHPQTAVVDKSLSPRESASRVSRIVL